MALAQLQLNVSSKDLRFSRDQKTYNENVFGRGVLENLIHNHSRCSVSCLLRIEVTLSSLVFLNSNNGEMWTRL